MELLALTLSTLSVIAALPSPPAPSVSVSVSTPVSVSVSVLPSSPETGTPFNVTCVTNVTADAATVAADGRSFPASLSGDGRRATATVTVTSPGSVRLSCTVRAGGREGSGGRTVHVYYLPAPLLNVTTSRPAAGTSLRGLCSLPANATRDIQLRVVAGDKVLAGWGQPPLAFVLPVSEEDEEELQLLCQAELENLVKNSSVSVTVLVRPHLNTSSCPSHQNWTEGHEETLKCRAWGRPPPQIRCSKDGNSLEIVGNSTGILGNSTEIGRRRRARRDHAGIYRCRATNELGTVERNITLWVQYDDSVPVLPLVLGTLLPILTLLILAGLVLLHRHNTKIGTYWLWRR